MEWEGENKGGGKNGGGKGKGNGKGKGGFAFIPGDWSCPECKYHQFARNTNCRKCNALKPKGAGKGSDGVYNLNAQGIGGADTNPEEEVWQEDG